jgi:hypothetical protein
MAEGFHIKRHSIIQDDSIDVKTVIRVSWMSYMRPDRHMRSER